MTTQPLFEKCIIYGHKSLNFLYLCYTAETLPFLNLTDMLQELYGSKRKVKKIKGKISRHVLFRQYHMRITQTYFLHSPQKEEKALKIAFEDFSFVKGFMNPVCENKEGVSHRKYPRMTVATISDPREME